MLDFVVSLGMRLSSSQTILLSTQHNARATPSGYPKEDVTIRHLITANRCVRRFGKGCSKCRKRGHDLKGYSQAYSDNSNFVFCLVMTPLDFDLSKSVCRSNIIQ